MRYKIKYDFGKYYLVDVDKFAILDEYNDGEVAEENCKRMNKYESGIAEFSYI